MERRDQKPLRHHPYSNYDPERRRGGGYRGNAGDRYMRDDGYGGGMYGGRGMKRGGGRGRGVRGGRGRGRGGHRPYNEEEPMEEWNGAGGAEEEYYPEGAGYEHGWEQGQEHLPQQGAPEDEYAPGDEDPEKKQLPAHIQFRIQRERPCRTLFVRNLHLWQDEEEVVNLFSRYGELKDKFNHIKKRGMMFLVYYDLRHAEKAKEELQSYELNGRKLDVHFSLPKQNELESVRCGRDKNQGTLFLTLQDSKEPLDNDELHEFFSQFGDVKVVREYKDSPYQRFIEFYDSRGCNAAYDAVLGREWHGGKLDAKITWDISAKDRAELAAARQRVEGKYREQREGAREWERSDRDRYDDREWEQGGGRGYERGRDWERGPGYERDARRDYYGREEGYDRYGGYDRREDFDRRYPQGDRYGDRYGYDGSQRFPPPMQPPNPMMPPYAQPQPQQRPPAIPAAGAAALNMTEQQRLEQAQKVQQLLAVLGGQAQNPAPPNTLATPGLPGFPVPAAQPYPGTAPLPMNAQPPVNQIAAQTQQLLQMLASAQQQQQQQQPQQPTPPQPSAAQQLQQMTPAQLQSLAQTPMQALSQHPPSSAQPPQQSLTSQPQAPGATAAGAQVAQLLQLIQQQQQQQQRTQPPPGGQKPPVLGPQK
ncbi:uncharacterized protein VTP21DRAFT_4097 [Calcarisporiella thermophila]|uniref:uncharacterized protein n=1 Tax=Calcarisporiella thermophila TaxID=911321 RepID=UPI0037424AA7